MKEQDKSKKVFIRTLGWPLLTACLPTGRWFGMALEVLKRITGYE